MLRRTTNLFYEISYDFYEFALRTSTYLLCSCEFAEKQFKGNRFGGYPRRDDSIAVTNVVMFAHLRFIYHVGDDSREDPPVPIPNTEVKLSYAESTWPQRPGG